MRHSHGLRAATGIVLPPIGAAYEGGFFAGAISQTANGVATHLLIMAPYATGYTFAQWKTTNTTTAGTGSPFDGAANTAAMVTAGIALHPAAQFCTGLSIGGYTDWYLPAPDELDIAYYNLKPTTDDNDTSFGINYYSVPTRNSTYTAGTPAQTTVAAFQLGGAEALDSNYYWSSMQDDSAYAWRLYSPNGNQGIQQKGANSYVRAFRKVAL